MGNSNSTPGTDRIAGKLRHWRGLVVVVVLLVGLWLFRDWISVWTGYSRLINTEARVINSIGGEKVGTGNKYAYIIRYEVPVELLLERKVRDSGTPEDRQALSEYFVEQNAFVLLKRMLPEDHSTTVEYFEDEAWTQYRVAGELQIATVKKYYLFIASIILVIAIFANRRK